MLENPDATTTPPSPLGPAPTRRAGRRLHTSELIELKSVQARASMATGRRTKEPSIPQSSLLLGLLGGLIGALAGAAAWAAIAIVANFEIGFVAVAVAFFVGCGVRIGGNGDTILFGLIGSLCSIFGVLLGKAACILLLLSHFQNIPITTFLTQIYWTKFLPGFLGSLEPMDIVFLVLAVVLGFKYSIRQNLG